MKKTGKMDFQGFRSSGYVQDFDISAAARDLGIEPGTARTWRLYKLDGELYAAWDGEHAGYWRFAVTKVRITEAKNGHTTMKAWGYVEGFPSDWYKRNEVDKAWHLLHPDTLRAIVRAIGGQNG